MFARFPKALASVYFPIVFKTLCRIHPPFQWRGGMICELFKNKGSSADSSNYRDIMLGNVNGKSFAKMVRRRLLPIANVVCGATQFGSGLNGGECAFAHVYLRLLSEVCASRGKSFAALFIDVSNAFAGLIRQILFCTTEGDEVWLGKLKNIGFSEGEIRDIYNTVRGLVNI